MTVAKLCDEYMQPGFTQLSESVRFPRSGVGPLFRRMTVGSTCPDYALFNGLPMLTSQLESSAGMLR